MGHLNNINLIVPELGTVTGVGLISPNNALNFNLAAQLSSAGGKCGDRCCEPGRR